jgi:cell division protein FtsW
VLSIFIQFFINIGVVIGLLPVTGVTLPFLSYGGSSLIMNFIMMGILVNISKSDILLN